MKKTVGIITFHKTINYGVYLQAYALQKSIFLLGYDSVIIDYNAFVEKGAKGKGFLYRILHFNETLTILKLKLFRLSNESKKRFFKFSLFSTQIFNLSRSVNSYNELSEIGQEYYKIVCGSDQIWNPYYTMNNPAYYLAFVPPCKRIAYAPSFGISNYQAVDVNTQKSVTGYLQEIKYLSVRERAGAEIIKQLTNRDATIVVDPTLLLSEKQWVEIEKRPENFDLERYVLIYMLGFDKKYRKVVENLKSSGHNVVVIPTNPILSKCGISLYAGVEEFLYLVHHADAVITDSFHGMIFSIVFRKNFYAIKREDTTHSLTSRIENFLAKVNLSERCLGVNDILRLYTITKTNYEKVEDQLNGWIEESRLYLKEALS